MDNQDKAFDEVYDAAARNMSHAIRNDWDFVSNMTPDEIKEKCESHLRGCFATLVRTGFIDVYRERKYDGI